MITKNYLYDMKKAITYFRVSTERQGVSGLGLEAQKETVDAFVKKQGFSVIKNFNEVESGKKNNRPELIAALAQCKKEKAILIIAKMDRLSRSVAFISNLMESKVEFVAVDNPYANELMVHMLAAFAQHERKAISTRTKEALQAAKRRGVKLGIHGKNVLSKQNKEAAEQFAQSMKPVLDQLRSEGYNTIRSITHQLNRRKIQTYRKNDNHWHVPTVHRLINAVSNLDK